MELDRRYITRGDFPAARRGYDPDEVDAHLRELADAVEELRRKADRPRESSIAGAAAEQVRIIVEAAEHSAREIEQRAQADAARTRDEAEADARDTRSRADAEAAEHIRQVEAATRSMLDRANSAEGQVEQLIDGLRSAAGGMVADLRGGSEQLGRELEEIRRSLGEVRDARPGASGARSAPPAPAAPEPDFEPEPDYQEPADLAPADLGPPDLAPQDLAPQHHDHAVAEAEPLKFQGDELHPGDVHAAPADIPPAPDREPYVPEPEPVQSGPPDAEPDVVRETRDTVEDAAAQEPEPAAAAGGATAGGSEGARLIALNMALNGSPREETAAYLSQNFDLPDADALLDEVYSRAGG